MAEVDYDAIAGKFGGKEAGTPPVSKDYDRLAAKFGGKDTKVGAVEDVVKTVPGIVPRAAAGLAGLPQTVARLRDAAVSKVAETIGADPDTTKKVLEVNGMMTPILGMFRKSPDLGEMTMQGWDEISKLVTGKPFHKPETPAGRIVDTTGQVMVSGPGSMLQKGVMGAAAGVSGEGTRLVTDNPVAIGVMQILGATAASLPFVLRSVPAENIQKAIQGISEQDLAKAQKLIDDSRRMGTPLTGAEAIAQVTGKNTLQDIQRVVEGSKESSSIIQPMMNERAAANARAFDTAAAPIAARVANPSETPVRMQQAASGALRDARQAGNAAARADYDAAAKQSIPAREWNTLTQDPTVQKALNAVKTDPIWGVSNEPSGSIRLLDAAKRWIDDELVGAKPAVSRILQDANTKIKSAADAASPEYASARSTIAQNRQQVVKPMEDSPVGDIARTGAAPGAPRPSGEAMMTQQSGILQPTAPKALDPATIKKTISTLNSQDPDVARQWTRQNLEALFNEAAQKNVGGDNQWGAAKFAAQIAGNPAQKENLRALIEETGGKRAWAGFERFLEVAEAQGKRLPPGSNTARDIRTGESLSAAGLPGAPAAATNVLHWPTVINTWVQNWRFGKNTAEMARILTDPKSVEMMKDLARYAPNDARATAIVGQIVSGNSGASAGSRGLEQDGTAP